MRIDGEPRHAVMLSAVSNSTVEKLCFSRHPESTKQASKLFCSQSDLIQLVLMIIGVSLHWLVYAHKIPITRLYKATTQYVTS